MGESLSIRRRADAPDRPAPAGPGGAGAARRRLPEFPGIESLRGRGTRPVPRPLPFLALTLLAAGCGLFEPRATEAPDDTTGAIGRPPLSPSDVIHNLRAAVQAADVELYSQALADSSWRDEFRFVADPALALDGQSVWGYDEEVAAWRNLADQLELADAPAPRLSFSSADSTLFGDSASFSADYFLELDPDREPFDGVWSGTLRFTFSRHPETGDWAIHRWEDWSSDSTAGWTRLKQEFLWP